MNLDRLLLVVGAGHILAGGVGLCALIVHSEAILGVHPASKPVKFAFSIGIFLLSLAVLLPALSVQPVTRRVLAWIFATTMLVEMGPIVVQALRGQTSHFNAGSSLDAVFWQLMVVAIVVASLAMLLVAWLASVRPLGFTDLEATAWRAALWIFVLVPISGFAMGGRSSHSIGGGDGGPGLPVVNWSTQHGDLRVPHFFALHALQILPTIAMALERSSLAPWGRWALLLLSIAALVVVSAGTLVQAFAGRPVW